MSKYSSMSRRAEPPPKPDVHPVMRGIGCLLMVIIPILAYGSAVLLVNFGLSRGWPIPRTWLGAATFPPLLMKLNGLAVLLNFLRAQNNLIANLVFAVAITIVIGGVMSIIYGYIFNLFGPPKYGPYDVPPPRVKVKRYKR